jgi:hypothetical protein
MAGGRPASVCCDLPIRCAGDDFCRFGTDFLSEYTADSGPDFYRGATITFAAGEIML